MFIKCTIIFLNQSYVKMSIITEGNELLDGETALPVVFSTDFDINKIWKSGNGVQLVIIDNQVLKTFLDSCC